MPAAVACSEGSDESTPELSSQPDAAPSTPIPMSDAAVSLDDAGSDASIDADADVDAAKPMRTCTDEGWCHVDVPDGQTLRNLWKDASGVVWTVSEKGNVLRWDGTAWVQSFAAGVPLYAIWGSSPTDIWVGGGPTSPTNAVVPGVLYHGTGTSPATLEWTQVAAPLTIRSLWGTSATDVWATASMPQRVSASDPSYILHYVGPDGLPGDGDAGDAGDAAAIGTGWLVDSASTAFKAHFEKIWGTGTGDIWVSARGAVNSYTQAGQVIHRRPDGAGGYAWSTAQPTTTDKPRNDTFGLSFSRESVFIVNFTTNSSGYAYYHQGVSTDDGATFAWTQHAAAETGFADRSLSVVGGTGPNDLWAAGPLGRLRHWDGTAWHVARAAVDDVTPVQQTVYDILASGPDDVWVVGANLALHKTAPSNP
ncbi:hypothetical protein AKJ09_01509 [Labilithrix luteola]|uniref:Type IV fimbrial biogenesis protein PilY1 n=1 Tax=Labilithrix luteola TaxID=1391654 RepID=A0A0K1PMT1_9BACT|nr:hypothetical protein AKJ09_01509 [Labilithrix luteola]